MGAVRDPASRVASTRVLAALGLLGLALVLAAPGAGGSAWIELFDGRSLAGWRMTGPGRFTVDGGALVSEGGMGLLWYERRRFRDFELQVEWRVANRCDNSGVFVRFPTAPRSPTDAVEGGYEVQIDDCDTNGARFTTGAIYGQAAAVAAASLPPGEWNRYLIRVVGQRYTVALNGRLVTTFVGDRGSAGYIGLQNHDPDSRVSFRAVRVRPLDSGQPAPASARLLVFTKTAGFRHESIPAAVDAVRSLAGRDRIAVDVTEDAAAFADANLRRYRAVLFLLTTGDVLATEQQAAFQRFVRAGGGYVGVHSAADTEHDWPWYVGLVGASFRSHPAIQQAAIDVVAPRHGSTAHLPRRWTRTDEWYSFDRNPRGSVRVLATLDESSYSPGEGAMGRDHPIAWLHAYDGGRAWYTAGGHTDESYAEPLFRAHLLGGIRYAAGLERPRIEAVRATVRNRRLLVSVRYADCAPCRGELRVRLPSRWLSVPMVVGGGTARATSPTLPAGRRRVSVVLENPRSRLRVVAGRWVRVP